MTLLDKTPLETLFIIHRSRGGFTRANWHVRAQECRHMRYYIALFVKGSGGHSKVVDPLQFCVKS